MAQDANAAIVGAKPWWMSKTILGAVGTAAVIVAGFFGVSIDEQTKNVVLGQTEALIAAAAALATTAFTIYGRYKATKAIGTARAVEAQAAAAHRADKTDGAFDRDFNRKV